MVKRRLLSVAVTVCCSTLALAAVSASAASASPRAEKLKAHPFIGFANETSAATFTKDVASGMAKEAKIHHDKLLSLTNAATDATALSNARIIADRHVTVAVEFQEDAKIGPEIAKMFERAGVKKSIAIDIPQPGAIFFGSSNWTNGLVGGEHLGEYAKKSHYNPNTTYVIEGGITTAGSTVALRMQGQLRGIEMKFPGIPQSHVLLENGGGTTSKTETLVADVLPKIPTGDHILVTSINTQTALGALRALSVAGRTAQAAIVSQGLTPIGIGEIKTDAHWVGDVAYFPELYGKEVFKLIADIQSGKHVTPYVYVPAVWITKSNINKYYPGKTLTSKKTPGALVFSKSIPGVKTGAKTHLAFS